MDRTERTFTDVVADVEPALLGTAFLLTGRRRDAQDAVVAALAAVHRHWRRLDPADARAEARRALVTELLRQHGAGPQAVEDENGDDDVPAADRAWLQALAGLPVRTRAAVVLRLYDGWDDDATADALGEEPATVAGRVEAALDELGPLLLDDVPAAPATAGEPPPDDVEFDDDDPDAAYRRPGAPAPTADPDAAFRQPETPTTVRRPARTAAPPAARATPARTAQDPDADALYRRPPSAEPRPVPVPRPPGTAAEDPDAVFRRPR